MSPRSREFADRHRIDVAEAVQLDERADGVWRFAGDREHRLVLVSTQETAASEARALTQIQPRSVAISTAWARSIAPSLPYTLCRCVRTVLVDSPSSEAICL